MAYCRLHYGGKGGIVPDTEMAEAWGKKRYYLHCKKCQAAIRNERVRPSPERAKLYAEQRKARMLERRKAADKARLTNLGYVLAVRHIPRKEVNVLLIDGSRLWCALDRRREGAVDLDDIVRMVVIYPGKRVKRTVNLAFFAASFRQNEQAFVCHLQEQAHKIIHGEPTPFSYRLSMARLFAQPSDAERELLAMKRLQETEPCQEH